MTKLVFVPKVVYLNAVTYRQLMLEGTAIPWAEENAKNIKWRELPTKLGCRPRSQEDAAML